jgi:hypothetical protein
VKQSHSWEANSHSVSWAELLCNWKLVSQSVEQSDSQSVSQSFRLGLEPLCDSWPHFSWNQTITGLMSLGVFPDRKTGLSPLLYLLLESSSLDPLESSLLDPLLESSSLDPPWSLLHLTLWSLLHSTIYWSLLLLTLWSLLYSTLYRNFLVWVSLSLSLASSRLQLSLSVLSRLNKVPTFYGIRRLITVFTIDLHRFVSCARWNPSTHSYPIPLRSIFTYSPTCA